MLARIWLKLAEILVPVLLAITIFATWQAERRDRAQLATQFAAAQQTIVRAAASQHDRDMLLNQTLAQIAAQKQSAATPDQILKSLPSTLSLPVPITLRTQSPKSDAASTSNTKESTQPNGKPTVTRSGDSAALPRNPTPKSGQSADAILPAIDLKPLYDFALDCKACQAKLAASQSDLKDEKTKSAALTKERDAAVRAAKGGSALRRIARAAKWFALGAAAGAVAAKVAR